MRALVDQLTAARDSRLRAPLFLVADSTAMAIAGANEHQRSERAGVDELARFEKGRMEAMIESRLDGALVLRGSCRDRLHLGERASRGLFYQHMAPGFDGADRH